MAPRVKWEGQTFGFEDEGLISPTTNGETGIYWCRPVPHLLCTVWMYGDELMVDIKRAQPPEDWTFESWVKSRNGTIAQREVPVDNPILVPVMVHCLVDEVTSRSTR